jgi:hypothetical protein
LSGAATRSDDVGGRAVECGVDPNRVINTRTADDLLARTAS